jgi:hypothetical protein
LVWLQAVRDYKCVKLLPAIWLGCAAGLGKVLANIRACMFAAWTFMLAIPLFIVMMTMALPVLALDKFRWVYGLGVRQQQQQQHV